jgi:uncharacterized protein YbaP (TraB family)
MKYIFVVLTLVLSGCASSSLKKAFEKPVLTTFSKNGQSHYLLGTIHLPLDVEKMYPQLLPMIDESSVFISEISFQEIDSFSKQTKVEENYYKPNEGSLQKDLSEPAYNMMKEELYFVSSSTFSTLKPRRAIDLLEERADKFTTSKAEPPRSEKLESLKGIALNKDHLFYDNQLENYARSKNKKMVSLDEPGLLAKCNQLEAISKIEALTFGMKKTNSEESMKTAYAKWDACVLSERNAAWVAKMKPLLAKGDKIFIAVGMGHLYGLNQGSKGTLVGLLEAEGFIVQPIAKAP